MRFNTLPIKIQTVLLERAKKAIEDSEPENLNTTLEEIEKKLKELKVRRSEAVKGSPKNSAENSYVNNSEDESSEEGTDDEDEFTAAKKEPVNKGNWVVAVSAGGHRILVEKQFKLSLQESLFFKDMSVENVQVDDKKTQIDELNLRLNLSKWAQPTKLTKFNPKFNLSPEENRHLAYKLLTMKDNKGHVLDFMPVKEYGIPSKEQQNYGFLFDDKVYVNTGTSALEYEVLDFDKELNQLDEIRKYLVNIYEKEVAPSLPTSDVFYTFAIGYDQFYKRGSKDDGDWVLDGRMIQDMKVPGGTEPKEITEDRITSTTARKFFNLSPIVEDF
jgi:hypothetical protein